MPCAAPPATSTGNIGVTLPGSQRTLMGKAFPAQEPSSSSAISLFLGYFLRMKQPREATSQPGAPVRSWPAPGAQGAAPATG